MRIALAVALALVACTAPPPQLPGGAAGAAARAAMAAARTDVELEAVLTDVAKALGARADEVVPQIRRTREAAESRVTAPKVAGRPRGLAVVRATPPRLLSTIAFGPFFASMLDPMTSGRGAGGETRSDPYTSTEEGATSRTTTTLNARFIASAAGSRVTFTMLWSYATRTVDKAGGAMLVDKKDDRTIVGVIDVCPDASGNAAATLNTNTQIVTTAPAATMRTTTTSNGFTGTVDDAAVLRSVRQDFSDQSSWQSSSGPGNINATLSATWPASESGITTTSASAFGGEVSSSGDAGDADRTVGQTLALDLNAVNDAYKEAQRLWRHGRCVVLQAFGAETPLATSEQEKPQHDETVQPGSETRVEVKARHRFGGGALSHRTEGALTSGGKTLTPSRLDALPGELTYKAPDEPDKRATARLRSTSKRGIGTLVLEFHTATEALVLTLSGTATTHQAFLGNTSEQQIRITIGPLEFKKSLLDLWSAKGQWRSTQSSVTANSLSTQRCEGSEQGEIEMDARAETRAGKKVWVIEPQSMSNTDGTGRLNCTNTLGGTTMRGVTFPGQYSVDTGGETPAAFLIALDPIVIPAEGGTIPVGGTYRDDRGITTSQGTATAQTKK